LDPYLAQTRKLGIRETLPAIELVTAYHRRKPGASIPQRQLCISLCFRFPPYFRTSLENFPILPLRGKIQFLSAKISDDTFPPISEKTSFPPTFYNFSMFSFDLCVFSPIYVFLLPPILTMMHLFIIQYMYAYWTPLTEAEGGLRGTV